MEKYKELVLTIEDLIMMFDDVLKGSNKRTLIINSNTTTKNKTKVNDLSAKIQNYPERIDLYLDRSLALCNLGLYKDALADLDKGECLIHEKAMSNPLKSNITESTNLPLFQEIRLEVIYSQKGMIFTRLGQYDIAINNITNAIGKKMFVGAQTTSLRYCLRACLYMKLDKFELAINDLNKSIEIHPSFYFALLCRGCFLYSKFGLNNTAISDFYTYFYHCIKNQDVSHLTELIPMLHEQPYSLATIAKMLHTDNLNLLLNLYDDSIAQIEDFILLTTYYNSSVQKTFIGNNAILLYYLKGYVQSYIIFDEIIDNGDVCHNLITAQEYFYYSTLASELNLEFKAIWNDSITKITSRNNLSDIDYYYLGQLYLLNGQKSESIDSFTKSKGYIFSQLMLCVLNKKRVHKSIVDEIIGKLNTIVNKNIIPNSPQYFETFHDFINLRECQIALDYLAENIPNNLVEQISHKEIWEIYHLSEKSRDELKFKSRKIKGNEHLDSMRNIMIQYIPIFPNPECIKNKIIDSDGKPNEILLNIKSSVEAGGTLENIIGSTIHKWEFNNESLYKEIILYYYSKQMLDSECVVNLLLYLLHIKLCKEKEYTQEQIYSVAKELLFLIPGFPIVAAIWEACSATKDDYEEGEEINNDFVTFTDTLWQRLEEVKGEETIILLRKFLNNFSIK